MTTTADNRLKATADTPRTDAQAYKGDYDKFLCDRPELVAASFARQLERELAAAIRELTAKVHDYEISAPFATIRSLQEELTAERNKHPRACEHNISWPHPCYQCEKELQERSDARYQAEHKAREDYKEVMTDLIVVAEEKLAYVISAYGEKFRNKAHDLRTLIKRAKALL